MINSTNLTARPSNTVKAAGNQTPGDASSELKPGFPWGKTNGPQQKCREHKTQQLAAGSTAGEAKGCGLVLCYESP